MIVVSGVLVLVALALLIAGLVVSGGLALIYASIGVSVVSGLCLLVGVRQRTEPASAQPAQAMAGAGGASATVAAPESAAEAEPRTVAAPVAAEPGPEPSQPGEAGQPHVPEAATPAADEAEVEAEAAVFIVPGRARYHLDGCRYLSGREVDELDIAEAVEEGYTPCGVCRPDEAFIAEPEEGEPAEELAEQDEVDDADLEEEEEPEAEAVEEPEEPEEPEPAGPATSATDLLRLGNRRSPATSAEPASAGRRGSGGTAAATSAGRRRTPTVLVLPGRGAYHREECRFVRNADDLEELTKATARRRGYTACGVCKP